MVRHVCDITHHLALVEHRGDGGHIVEMARSFRVWSIHNDIVIGLQGFGWNGLECRLDCRQHHTQVQGGADLSLCDYFTLAREHGSTAVAPVLDVRGVRGPDESRHHLIGNRVNGVGHDLKGDRIDLGPANTDIFFNHTTFS